MNFTLNKLITIIGAQKWSGYVEKKHDIESGYHIHPWGDLAKKFEPSLDYDSTDLVFVIPPGREISFIGKIVMPFNWIVWICLVASVLLAAVLIQIIKNIGQHELKRTIIGWRTKTPIWNLINIVLNGSIVETQLPRTNFARFVLLKILIFSLVFRSAYTGSLYGFVERDIHTQSINKINDLFEKNFTFYVTSRSGKNSGYLVEFDDLKEVLPSMDQILLLWNQLLTNPDFKGVFVLDLDIVLYKNAQLVKNGKPLFNYLNENVMTNPRIFAFPRNSQLASKVSQFILRFQESGLIAHWKKTFIPKLKPPSKQPKQLTLDKILGLLGILAGGYTLSLIAFIVENSTRIRCFIVAKLRRYSIP